MPADMKSSIESCLKGGLPPHLLVPPAHSHRHTCGNAASTPHGMTIVEFILPLMLWRCLHLLQMRGSRLKMRGSK